MPINPSTNPEILATKGLHLFHFSTSNCSMRIRLQLEEKKIPWVDRYMDIRTQKNLTEEYFAIHPQGLVPAIIHNGTIVYESADIMLYIEEHFPENSLIPSDDKKKAEMDSWLEFTRVNHVPIIKTWVYGRNNKPTKTKEIMPRFEQLQKDEQLVNFHRTTLSEGGIPEEKILAAEKVLLDCFTKIENNLNSSPWILGDEVTLADIAWIPQYSLFQRNGFPFDRFPNVMAWVARWKQRPSYQEAIGKWMPGAA